jgi:hypothetical protein
MQIKLNKKDKIKSVFNLQIFHIRCLLEKYLPISITILSFIFVIYYKGYYLQNIKESQNIWLGSSSMSFTLSTIIMTFIFSVKTILLSIDKTKYLGLKTLDENQRIKKTFYSNIDKTIYISFLLILINLLYVIIEPIFKNCNLYIYFLSIIISSTTYLICSVFRCLRALHIIQHLSFNTPH